MPPASAQLAGSTLEGELASALATLGSSDGKIAGALDFHSVWGLFLLGIPMVSLAMDVPLLSLITRVL